ncbi:MAG: helix-turn-helix domain-containing protein [Oscillospiraceae bacterium]|nr:helix-turn-helix domain-containing protein [Oscillospiraceae bacterium]
MPDNFTAIPCGCATLSVERDDKGLSIHLDGPTAKPYMYGSQVNLLRMVVTIEFNPAGLYALTGINQNELADESLPFEAVNPKLSKSLSETVEKAHSVAELATDLDKLLLRHMYTAHHPQLLLSLQHILGSAGNVSVKKLADDIHYSERQLNRIFKQHVGISTKSFSKLVRINKTFRLLKKPNIGTAFISDVMGFHDLSHFIRDFKSVCGVTPGEYRNNMSDFYINTSKF